MGRFKPKEENTASAPAKVYTQADYDEMVKQVEKARKYLAELKEEKPKVYDEVRGTQAAWMILQGGATVLPYHKGKDDPKTDLHYFAVRPGPYQMLSNKWAWYEKERDKRDTRTRHDDRAYEGMAEQLGGKMKV